MSIAEKVMAVAFIVMLVLLHSTIVQAVKDTMSGARTGVANLAIVVWAGRVRLRYARAIAGAKAGWNSVTVAVTPAVAPVATVAEFKPRVITTP